MIITDVQLVVDQKYAFHLNLPESAQSGSGFPFDGCCRWSEYNDFAGWWENGIQMAEVSDEAKATIARLVEDDPVPKSDQAK